MFQAFGEALKPLLRRLGEFFDLFDLSFFVSGGISLLAGLYLLHTAGVEVDADGVGLAVAMLLLAYVLGLGCFTFGRSLRTPLGWLMPKTGGQVDSSVPFGRKLRDAAIEHGLDDDPIVGPYLEADGAKTRLYPRIWAETRDRAGLRASFDFANHSWVLAATYDGVAAASLLWAFALLTGYLPGMEADLPASLIPLLAAGLVGFSVLCSYEARRHGEHQMESLMATMAHLRQARTEAEHARAAASGLLPPIAAPAPPKAPEPPPAP
jgi:hypothetical protein